MFVGRGQRRWPRAVVVIAALLAPAVVSRAARATEDQVGQPWFPLIENGASPADVYDSNALSVIHGGEDGWRVDRGKYRAGVARADFFVTVGRPEVSLEIDAPRGVGPGYLAEGLSLRRG